MASTSRPSLLFPSLLLFFLFSAAAVDDEFYRNTLGTLGKHYNLRKGVPYIQCEAFNGTVRTSEECSPAPKFFFGRKFGCNAVLRVKEHTKYLNMDTDGRTLERHEYEGASSNCWHGGEMVHEQCLVEDECIAEIRKDKDWLGMAFCCCNTHRCNERITVRFAVSNRTEESEDWPWQKNSTTSTALPVAAEPSYSWVWIPVFVMVLLIVLAILFVVCRTVPCLRVIFFSGSDQKVFDVKKPDEVPLVENGKKRSTLNGVLTYKEKIAEGKMGWVHKAIYMDPDLGKERIVVVKNIKDQKSFILEETVYNLVRNSNAHLAHFFGSTFDPVDPSYHVVIEYYELGCLENYLKETIFTPLEALSFLCTLMDGLDYLHSPCRLPSGDWKAPIVHRDIKSRNVMVKSDRTAAIADFGLAMVCEGNRPYGRHYQVGTHRYMSPELLAGMAKFTVDGLKQADVYAAALIIWEILNRTVIDENDELGPAELPYTKEIEEATAEHKRKFEEHRSSPLEEYTTVPVQYHLKAIVHREDKRPVLRERLKSNPITAELIKTTLDMWDREVDGRISAACARSRLQLLEKNAINGTIPQPLC
ncbi:hypothetical protein PMAYCL1PPCAC_11775 [Pristionchus mayeri]|uniref:Serine/threonine-protein kinase receptor n=1 Tax=Pristionchus mayeri TaxID=1317129 RepID=A0AAN4ZR09_9BILA|nr:hypothetical protein PMAYCL1PPCAC_11775 [Pristionchus mayeri]